MARTNKRNQKGWRRLIGWLAPYLVGLHVSFAGASPEYYFAQANDAADGAAFCLNGADGSSSPADAPAHSSHGKVHCVLCASGGSLAPSPGDAFAPSQLTPASALIPASEEEPGKSGGYSPHQSRAPPLEV